jgi:hypothetical protein
MVDSNFLSWAIRASRLEVIEGCWAQDRTAGRTSLEKVTSTHASDEFAGRPWSVLT